MTELKKTKAELLAARNLRNEEAAKKAEAHDLLCLELEDRFCTELGPRGEAWEMVNDTTNTCGIGPICVKKPDPVAHKSFQAKLAKGGTSTEDECAYVSGGILWPERSTWNVLAGEYPQLVARTAIAVTKLFGYEEEKTRGK